LVTVGKLSLLVLLAACGHDQARRANDAAPDGVVADVAASDVSAADADGALPAVTVSVTADGAAVPNVAVVFLNADSSVVLSTTTDTNGAASAVMAAGGSVTVVDAIPGSTRHTLETRLAVQPGDHLEFFSGATTPSSISVNVTAPVDSSMTQYAAYSPCNMNGGALAVGSAQSVQGAIALYGCGATTDVLVLASNGSGSEFAYAPAVPISDQGTVDLTAATYAPTLRRTYTYSNVPDDLRISVMDIVRSPSGMIYRDYADGPLGASTSMTIAIPAFSGATDILETVVFRSFATLTLLDWGSFGSAVTTDVATRELYPFTGDPTFDAATRTATIPVDTSTGLAPDFSGVALSEQPQTSSSWYWTILTPTAASVTLPTLPVDVVDFDVGSGNSIYVDWTMLRLPGGYDAFRRRPENVEVFVGTGTAALEYSHDHRTAR